MPTAHLKITGKVQGVFYRVSAKEAADKIGVTGWVKNTHEGNVEAIITGTKTQIDEFVNWCKKGPSHAEVETVFATKMEETLFSNFEVKR